MSKTRYDWWSYINRIIGKFPNNQLDEERQAVQKAINATMALRSGSIRMEVVEMVLMRGTHTPEGAAMKAHVSESSARNYISDFKREVARNYRCPKGLI